MGIHFACHHCNHALHVKDFQAGKRGKCPACKGLFRIPISDASHSVALDADNELEPISVVAEDEPSPQKLSQSSTKTQSRKEGLQQSATASTATNLSKTAKPKNVSAPTSVMPPASTDATSIPIALASASGAAWFVRPPTGGQFGPASSQLLWDWIVEKRVTFDSFLWREGMVQWQLANEVIPELFGPTKPPTVPPIHPGSNPPPVAMLPGAATTATPGPVADQAPSSSAPPLTSVTMVSGPASMLAPAPIAPATVPSTSPQVATPSSLAKKKREQKRRKQLMAIIVLSVLSIILLVVLIVVLVMQSIGTSPAIPST